MTVTHIAVNGDFAAGQGTPVAEAAQRHPKVYQELIYAAALCNDASLDPDHPGQIIGDPTEGALIYRPRPSALTMKTWRKPIPVCSSSPSTPTASG